MRVSCSAHFEALPYYTFSFNCQVLQTLVKIDDVSVRKLTTSSTRHACYSHIPVCYVLATRHSL